MLIVQSVIVGVIYLVLGFLEEYLSFPMCSLAMVVGSVIGFFLGDLKTGVMIGASWNWSSWALFRSARPRRRIH